MKLKDLKKYNLPESSGVYYFLKQNKILYIGKATNLKDRVKSYFGKDLINTRGPLIVDMVFKSDSIKWKETDTVLEALILEANEIKKYQPYYNTKEKDDKSFNYVYITKPARNNTLGVLDGGYKLGIIRGKELNKNFQKVKNPKNSFFQVLPRPSGNGQGGSASLEPDHSKKSFLGFFKVFGPFPNGGQLREALKIIRKFFPYIEDRKGAKGKEEFYKQIKLNPESVEENKKNIKNIILFFEGKKKRIINLFKKEMLLLAKQRKFEEANEMKRKIFALEHINDIALIKEEKQNQKQNQKQNYSLCDLSNQTSFSQVLPRPTGNGQGGSPSAQPDRSKKMFGFNDDFVSADNSFDSNLGPRTYNLKPNPRMEAYDIAHLSGKNMVGVMVVLEDGELNKSKYRKFSAKGGSASDRKTVLGNNKPNDTGALQEILERRLNHPEWKFPDVIIVDGGKAQINVAERVLKERKLNIKVFSVLKNEKHKPKSILFSPRSDLKGAQGPTFVKKHKKEILLLNNEAHRFAIKYHKQMRDKNFLKK